MHEAQTVEGQRCDECQQRKPHYEPGWNYVHGDFSFLERVTTYNPLIAGNYRRQKNAATPSVEMLSLSTKCREAAHGAARARPAPPSHCPRCSVHLEEVRRLLMPTDPASRATHEFPTHETEGGHTMCVQDPQEETALHGDRMTQGRSASAWAHGQLW